MPELPEVEGFRKYLNETALKQKVTAVSHVDEKPLQVPLSEFENAVVGNAFEDTQRIGKYLFLKMKDNCFVMMHCGMTGRFEYFNDLELLPKHTRLLYHFENGYHLAFVDARRFGKVDLTSDVEEYRKAKKLGLDMLEMDQEAFIKILLRKKGKIKTLLMNQSYFAGIGNWIADDALFQAGIHPETDAQLLKVEDHILLYEKVMHCIHTALELDTDYAAFPRYFLVNHRKEGTDSPNGRGTIERIQVGGRSTYFAPETQKLKELSQ